MPNRLPVLKITSPLPDAVVGNAPFAVTGSVTAPGKPEPVSIQSVSVQIDSQPPVHATVKHIPVTGNQEVYVTFDGTLQVTAGQDPHVVTVIVASDAGRVTGTVTVTAGLRFVAPAAWADIEIPVASALPFVVAQVQAQLPTIAQAIAPLPPVSGLLAMNKMLVGPNLVAISNPPVLRIGFWILDIDFAPQELIQPADNFPLPQLTPQAATGCFNLVPLQLARFAIVPPAKQFMFTFALSIPTTTLQLIADALVGTINAMAESQGLTVNSITVQTGDNKLAATVSGSYDGVSVSGTVTETLGIEPRPGTQSNMAAVLSTSISSPLLDVLSAIPVLGQFILAGENQASGDVQSNLVAALDSLPAWIPFRNSLLGSPSDPLTLQLQLQYPFPMAVLNFDSFGTSASEINATGTGSLANRDQSMVAVHLDGPDSIPNYSYGIAGNYEVVLTAFEPDNDQMTWQLSSVPRTNIVDTDAFSQEGAFAVTFPVPPKASSGRETFTVSVNGTETCTTDNTKVLTGSAALAVTITLAKGQPEAEPAANAMAGTATPVQPKTAPKRGRVA